MKIFNALCALASVAFMASCDLGTPPQVGGGTEVEGVIVDGRGNPAVGAWVRFYPASEKLLSKGHASSASALEALDSAKTNSLGAFVVPDLPAGTYNLVTALRRNDTALALFRRSVVVAGDLDLGTDTLRVAGGLSLALTVQGYGAVGAQCYIPASPYVAQTNSEGVCTLTGVAPGTYQVSVAISGLPVAHSGSVVVTSLQVASAGSLNLEWNPGAALSAPVLTAPANRIQITSDTATLFWNAVAGATSYDIQASPDSLFRTFSVNDTARPGLNRSFRLLDQTKYHWRVRARNSLGVSAWSATWSFTAGMPFVDCVISPNQAPVLLSPANLAANLTKPVAFTWQSLCGATGYHLQIATDSAFGNVVYAQDSLLSPSASVSGTLNTGVAYYWRVDARFPADTFAVWSASRRFTLRNPSDSLAAPVLTVPANGAIDVSTLVSFAWNSVAGADHYLIEVSTNSNFTNIVRRSDSLAATSIVIGLSGSTQYFWRVRANRGNEVSPFLAYHSFTTEYSAGTVPGSPALWLPVQDSVGVSTTPTLYWEPVAGVSFYKVQVSTDSNFATLAVNDSIAATSRTVGPLSANTQYFWRVGAVNGIGITFSTRRRFLTKP